MLTKKPHIGIQPFRAVFTPSLCLHIPYPLKTSCSPLKTILNSSGGWVGDTHFIKYLQRYPDTIILWR